MTYEEFLDRKSQSVGERAIILGSNPDEIVLTPFMGVGSEVHEAILNNRRAIGIELKPGYFNQAVKNVEAAQEGREKVDGELNFEPEKIEMATM